MPASAAVSLLAIRGWAVMTITQSFFSIPNFLHFTYTCVEWQNGPEPRSACTAIQLSSINCWKNEGWQACQDGHITLIPLLRMGGLVTRG